jgi:hypothetical protein
VASVAIVLIFIYVAYPLPEGLLKASLSLWQQCLHRSKGKIRIKTTWFGQLLALGNYGVLLLPAACNLCSPSARSLAAFAKGAGHLEARGSLFEASSQPRSFYPYF